MPQKPTCMWLLSCFFTSGWIHSCSREPSTHTRGLAEERTMGSKNQRVIAPVPSSSLGVGCVGPTGSTGRHGSHVHSGSQKEWLRPEWTLCLGRSFSAAWLSVSKETRQGKQADGRGPSNFYGDPANSIPPTQEVGTGPQDSYSSAGLQHEAEPPFPFTRQPQ